MIRFHVNLKTETESFLNQSGFSAGEWLLSSHRASPGLLELAKRRRAAGDRLMADNGTIEFIRQSEAAHANLAAPLMTQWDAFRRSLPEGRRTPFSAEVPPAMRLQARDLFRRICLHADEVRTGIDPAEQIDVQLSMQPSHLIAQEDWSVSVALGLGLERELLGLGSRDYVSRARQSLRGWQEAQGDSRIGDAEVFVTLGACDFITARAVGREAARWNARNIAIGFAGLNSDNSYCDVSHARGRRKLDRPAPRRYVRLAEIACGLREGFMREGVPLERLHALGLGARAMWPILAAGLDEATQISVDATSSIKDATGPAPVVYVPDAPEGRMAVSELATHWLREGALPFASPLLERGLKELPGDTALARELLASSGGLRLRHEDLDSRSPLGRALPLFAHGPGSDRGGDYLVHHNYWASIHHARQFPRSDRVNWALAELERMATAEGISLTVRNGCAGALDVLSSCR